MIYTEYSFRNVFQYEDDDIYWCTRYRVDHWSLLYNLWSITFWATTVMFEGIPTYPNPSRFWQEIEKNKVNIFYTA